jgi:hypothetical protein
LWSFQALSRRQVMLVAILGDWDVLHQVHNEIGPAGDPRRLHLPLPGRRQAEEWGTENGKNPEPKSGLLRSSGFETGQHKLVAVRS